MINYQCCSNCNHYQNGKCKRPLPDSFQVLNEEIAKIIISTKRMMPGEGMYCKTYKGDKKPYSSKNYDYYDLEQAYKTGNGTSI